jgi:hypothetical protein
VDQIVQQRLQARAALAGMASLPELQRQVLVSTTLEGASHEQVATALGLTNGSVRGLIYRARAAVRAAAAAVIPSPVLGWAVRHSESRGARTSAIVESAIGGGGAGVAGLIAKGSAVIAITAIAAGGTIVPNTTSHRPDSAKRRTELHQTGGSSISGRLVAHRARDEAPGTTTRNGSAAAAAARVTSGSRSGRGDSSGSTGGSGGASTSGRDGGSSGGSDGGSHGASPGGSDGGSSFATTQSSGSTPGGSTHDLRVSSASSLSEGGSSGGSGSDGGMSGTSGGQVTTATTSSSGTSGPDGGSSGGSGSSGSGDTTATPGTP